MANDDPDEAGNPKECHEPEGRAHDRQRDQRFDRSKDFRREDSGRRKAQYRNGAKMLAAPYATRFKNVPHGGNRKQRNSSILPRGINIETLDLRQLCTILRAQTGNDRDAFVPFFEGANWCSADRGCGGIGYVSVRDAYQVRAIRINLNLYL